MLSQSLLVIALLAGANALPQAVTTTPASQAALPGATTATVVTTIDGAATTIMQEVPTITADPALASYTSAFFSNLATASGASEISAFFATNPIPATVTDLQGLVNYIGAEVTAYPTAVQGAVLGAYTAVTLPSGITIPGATAPGVTVSGTTITGGSETNTASGSAVTLSGTTVLTNSAGSATTTIVSATGTTTVPVSAASTPASSTGGAAGTTSTSTAGAVAIGQPTGWFASSVVGLIGLLAGAALI